MLPLIFLVGRRLWNATGGLLAASLAACAPLLIQAAHFGTVDSMVTLAAVATLWLSLRIVDGARLWAVPAAGLVIGLAIATKLTAASFLLMPAVACLASGQSHDDRQEFAVRSSTDDRQATTSYRPQATNHMSQAILAAGIPYLVLLGTCGLTALIASPYYVLAWNELWAAIREQTNELSGGYGLSYTWHFIGTTPYIFEGSNLLMWGLGLATGLAGLAGWVWSIVRIALRRAPVLPTLLLVLWPTLYFLYIGTWEARFVRHTLPLVPFICLFAGGALSALLRSSPHHQDAKSARHRQDSYGFESHRPMSDDRQLVASSRWHGILSFPRKDRTKRDTSLTIGHRSLVVPLALAFSALWGLAFLSIYTSTDTRLAATDWFHANVPAGAHLVVEDKDTLIPLPDAAHPVQTYYLGVIEPTTPDSPAKLASMASTLASGEFLVISSRRWSDTIPRLPAFPTTARYYGLLFAGKLGYTPAATFSSPPRLGPLEFPDDSAEETFQVFDHPTVRIFRNTAHLPPEQIAQLLEK
jgi:hypothetical protein